MPIPDTTLLAAPEPGGGSPLPAPDASTWNTTWATITNYLSSLPSWSTAAVVIALGAVTLLTFPMLRGQAFKAGQRAARGGRALTPAERQDRKLLLGALIPAVIFWIAVLAGSARGLTAFGRDDLTWNHGWDWLVPLTLDGVAIAFALLAFRAIKKKLNPDKATRIAWGAMLASAGLNFYHEFGGSVAGAIYLAILSVLGMLIFHEFLAQFEEGTGYISRENPRFGMRWFTWPTNTACAWFAWRNYPPAEGTKATVGNAVAHLKTVRAAKASHRAVSVDRPAWWIYLTPWLRTEQFVTALTELRSALRQEQLRAERAERDTQFLADAHRTVTAETVARMERQAVQEAERISAEHENTVQRLTEQLDAVTAERDDTLTALRTTGADLTALRTAHRTLTEQHEQDRLRAEQSADRARELLRTADTEHKLLAQRHSTEQTVRAQAEQDVVRLRIELAEQSDKFLGVIAEQSQELAALRSAVEQNGGNVVPLRPARRSTPGTRSAPDDTKDLAEMFSRHPERDFEWSTREIKRITGAGFSSRAPRLLDLATKHQTDCPEQTHAACFTERSGTRTA